MAATSLTGFLQLIEARVGGGDEQLAAMLATALRQARRLSRLTQELMDAERLHSGRLHLSRHRVDLREVVQRAVEAARPLMDGQSLRHEVGSEPLIVEADADRLEQVMLNLIGNAVTHAPASEYIDIRMQRSGAEAEIQVQDYGPGIPKPELPRIFSRFYQVPHGEGSVGLGLGLYIAHQIVAAHGGTIDAASRDDEGSTFTIRLPLAKNAV